MKHYTTADTKVVGMYLANSKTLTSYNNHTRWHCTNEMPYLPILTCIHIDVNNRVSLSSSKGIKNDIDTFNSNFNLQRFNEDVMKTTKIDITTNSLIVGPVNMVFNFTGTPLTITPSFGIAETHDPFTLDSIPAMKGKLVFMSIHFLRTQESVESTYGAGNNYLTQRRDLFVGKTDQRSVEIKEIYDYVIKTIATNGGHTTPLVSDTYKVATMTAVDVNKIFESKDFKDKKLEVIHVCSLNVDITRLGMVEAPLHDSLMENFAHDAKAMESIRAHGHSCFIVDNQKKLSPRFFTYAGYTMLVPNIQDPHRLDGFYLMDIDANKKVEPRAFTPLSEIHTLKSLFDNQEEAEQGANTAELLRQELERTRTEQGITESKEAIEYKKKIHEMDIAHKKTMQDFEQSHRLQMQTFNEERVKADATVAAAKTTLDLDSAKIKLAQESYISSLKAELERKKQETDLFKYQFDQSRYRMDNNSMYMKQNYEEGRYQRDTTIETIKTAGAVAGLLAGGYVLFNKLR